MTLHKACLVCDRIDCTDHRPTGARGSTRQWRTLRVWVLQRDGNRCTVPSCSTHDKLEIHHLDGDANNNAVENLTTLCETHHREAERSKRTLA